MFSQMTLAYAAGIALAGWVSNPLALVALAPFAALGSRWREPRRAVCGLLVSLLGFSAVDVPRDRALAAEPPDGIATLEGDVVEQLAYPGGLRLKLCRLRLIDPVGAPPPCAVIWLRSPPLPRLVAGDRLRVQARLRRPSESKNPGAEDRRARSAREGVGWEGRLVHPTLWVRLGPDSLWDRGRRRAAEWRARMARGLAEHGPGGGLFAALALGERTGLPRSAREDLAALGVSHLLAVSGLHVGLFAWGVFRGTAPLARRFAWWAARFDPRSLSAGVSLAAVWGYALATGLAVPVQRAAVFATCILWGAVQARRLPVRSVISLGAAFVLWREPHALFEAGTQLSFSAAWAMLTWLDGGALRRTTSQTTHRFRRLARNCDASLVALLATGPLSAWHFGSVSHWALPANLLAIPLVAGGLLPLAFTAVLGEISSPGARWVGWMCGAGALALEGAASLAEALPGTGSGATSLWRWVPAAIVTSLGLFYGRRLRTRFAALLLMYAVLGLPAIGADRASELWFFDVGHGDSALLRDAGVSLLIDAGGAGGHGDRGRDTLAPALTSLGVGTIDLLVVSHADLDHRGGAPSLLRRFRVGELWLPFGAEEDPGFAELRATAARYRVPVKTRGLGSPSVGFGAFRLQPLWPPRKLRGEPTLSDNDRSLVLRIEHPEARVLFTGDIESRAEAALLARNPQVLDADILKVAHHGSGTSSGSAWIDAVSPRLAVISAAHPERFGLPSPLVSRRFQERGIDLRVTGRSGALRVPLSRPFSPEGWLSE